MTTYEFGDVLLVPFPFTEQETRFLKGQTRILSGDRQETGFLHPFIGISSLVMGASRSRMVKNAAPPRPLKY